MTPERRKEITEKARYAPSKCEEESGHGCLDKAPGTTRASWSDVHRGAFLKLFSSKSSSPF